jgi:hypothetical protein
MSTQPAFDNSNEPKSHRLDEPEDVVQDDMLKDGGMMPNLGWSSINIKSILIPVGISVALFIIALLIFQFVPANTYKVDLTNTNTSIKALQDLSTADANSRSELEKTVGDKVSEVNRLIDSMNLQNYWNKAELSLTDFARISDLNNKADKSEVPTKEQLKVVSDKNDAQDEQIKALQDEVAALKATGSPTPTTTPNSSSDWVVATKGQVTATLNPYLQISGLTPTGYFKFDVRDGKDSINTFKISVTNTGVSSIAKDIQLLLGFYWIDGSLSNWTAPPSWVDYTGDDANFIVSSTSISWVNYSHPNYSLFYNGVITLPFGGSSSTLTLNPQETKTILVTATIKGNSSNDGFSYILYPYLDVNNYTQVLQ